VRHLQKQQVGQLIGVFNDVDTIVTKHSTERPEFVDQLAGWRLCHSLFV
jgi:hypothetical protein